VVSLWLLCGYFVVTLWFLCAHWGLENLSCSFSRGGRNTHSFAWPPGATPCTPRQLPAAAPTASWLRPRSLRSPHLSGTPLLACRGRARGLLRRVHGDLFSSRVDPEWRGLSWGDTMPRAQSHEEGGQSHPGGSCPRHSLKMRAL